MTMPLTNVARRAAHRLLLTANKPLLQTPLRPVCRRLPVVTRQFTSHSRSFSNPQFYHPNNLESSSSEDHAIVEPDPLLVNQIFSPDPNKPFKIDLQKTPKSEFDPAFAAAIRDDGTIDYDKFDIMKIDLSDEVNFSPIMARAILLKPGPSLRYPFFPPPGGKPGTVPTD